ncbi:class II D-tagatose-bisphosphate aldolase, non-catalytic subunit [Sediminispirochaeta smaragdinae]|uniref:D-tagatose-bisphosphate aldolase class II accessory protein AgaZ n=1 Tax=Sediminispirochaeta smaragdinae (strain DSM 11293 / JCM 15392 / SEBR 4228) TaxID=573413 RepID=E1R0X8_SEDSS|nr:class II D-tagatose-bisphosphate aldolase, non-catalytic subunit [Sediminispirochaeta smaragdinae]ADK80227.1 D-tagatose-bisphosphate aldolase class II accessory protein AgaZ [Sediminispirochaeta smaragdinae DSM 11293]
MRDIFEELITARENDDPFSLYSVCSANQLVLETAVRRSVRSGLPLLIEATANQVNQEGGYTGMRPSDFAARLQGLCDRYGADRESIVFGGDHLGPYPWRKLAAEKAMQSAETLVRAFVAAGARKIHLDASMHLGGDTTAVPDPRIAASRAAQLCRAAEDEYEKAATKGKPFLPPVYVIGTEVPVPGGTLDDDAEPETGPAPTSYASLLSTLELHEEAFYSFGLHDAWRRVIGVVVQPGLEFGSEIVHPYKRRHAEELKQIFSVKANLFFEAHSTDYQSSEALGALARDGFAFLKVGPALTFAYREALVGLAYIEQRLHGRSKNRILESLSLIMRRNDKYWRDYYAKGDDTELIFSLSDRVRYYWDDPVLVQEVEQLFQSIDIHERVTPGLVSQYLPRFSGPHTTSMFLSGLHDPREFVMYAIDAELSRYEQACFSNRGCVHAE